MIIWSTCDIPAKLFYNEVIAKSNLSVLGKGTPEQLDEAFKSIIDELCVIENNVGIINLYRKRFNISKTQLILSFVETTLHQIAYLKLTDEERLKRIQWLNNIKGVSVKFNTNKPILEEIERVSVSVLGSLRNKLKSEIQDDEKKTEKAVGSFEKRLGQLSIVLGWQVSEDLSLRYFCELCNGAKEKIKIQNQHGSK